MLKYIRTKDGIYEVVEDNNKEWGKQIVVKFPKNLNMKLADVKDQIINQSDNLDELCDEFVIDWLPTNHKDIFSIDEYSKKIIESCIGNDKTNVYGAIWTSKGLIYVAKMNENGVLELI